MSIKINALNGFLKNSETISILPAIKETRDTKKIHWYEVQVNQSDKLARIIACDINGETISIAEAKVVGEYGANLTVTENGEQVFVSEIVYKKSGIDTVNLQTKIGDFEVNLTGRPDDHTSIQRQDNMIAPKQKLPEHWLTLRDNILTLAEALKIRAIDGKSWGCTSCLVFLVGDAIAAGGCAGSLEPGICAAAFTGWGVFSANCEGSCAE